MRWEVSSIGSFKCASHPAAAARGHAPGKHGCGLANAVAGSRLWVSEVCAGAVYIGDNSKLVLGISRAEARTWRPTAKSTVPTLCTPRAGERPLKPYWGFQPAKPLKSKRCVMNIILNSEVTAEEPRETYSKSNGQFEAVTSRHRRSRSGTRACGEDGGSGARSLRAF